MDDSRSRKKKEKKQQKNTWSFIDGTLVFKACSLENKNKYFSEEILSTTLNIWQGLIEYLTFILGYERRTPRMQKELNYNKRLTADETYNFQ